MIDPQQPSVAVESATTEALVPASTLADEFAQDSILYCHAFFSDTFRDKTAPFHRAIWEDLDNPAHRQVAIEVFRGGAKTTTLRAVTSKRIAYGISRTILYVSGSMTHSLRSVRWLRKQIEYNKKWTSFFGLSKGGKWTDEHLEIKHDILGYTITILAVGITGQTRGINVDDYRPDFIVVDDADDEETTATPEQRAKTENRFFGAILNSLAPRSENPEAKAVVLATSLHKDDLINKCHIDPTWKTSKFSIYDDDGESRWPSRYPTEEVNENKSAFLARGQTLLWLREFECVIGDEETALFRRDTLKLWELLPDRMIVVLACDPAPPPSDIQIRKGLRTKDEEVWSAVGMMDGQFYLLEQQCSRDHDAEWSITTFFNMLLKWRPIRTGIESVAYQRTLKSFIEREMKARKIYGVVEARVDRRKKPHRIQQALGGISSLGAFHVHASHQGFITQFYAYPNADFDDRLDSVAIGLDMLHELSAMDEDGSLWGSDESMKPLTYSQQAP